jgi:membrane-bound lytic murein transglycosylase D
MLRPLLASAFGLLLFSFARAGNGEINPIEKRFAYSDTADKKDSLNLQQVKQENDSKQEFRELLNNNNVTTVSNAFGLNLQQLNPQAISFVEDYADKFGELIEEIKEWGKPYFAIMDVILAQHGLPKELKYLAVIESNLKGNARSWAGAVGPWQFMPGTAKTMGLKVGRKYDERKDFSKSTHAASKYLTDLYAIYGDWLLVIAAYNCGPGKVNSAIKKSKSRDFWVLQKYLPAESKNHVKKFIATHYMIEGQGSIATLTSDEAKNITANAGTLMPEELANSKAKAISGRYSGLVIAKYITMDIASFNKMNPDFDKLISSNGNYELRLPSDKMDLFFAKKQEILNESMELLLKPVANSGSN